MLSFKKQLRCWIISMLVLLLCSPSNAPASAAAFTDLQGHWSEQAVTRVATLDLIKGYPSGQFMPDRQVSLLETIVLLLKACGYNADSKPNTTSAANQPGMLRVPWGQPYVDTALAKKIIPEDLIGAFDPAAPATRSQTAAILGRLLMLPVSTTSATGNSISDLGEAPATYIPYIAAVLDAGLMKGYGDGSFAPQKGITRGEMAALLAHMIDLDWAQLPANRRAGGWIRRSSSVNKAQSTELVSLQGTKSIQFSPSLTCFSEGKECSLSEIMGDRVEVLFDTANQAACISMLEKRPAATQGETVRGTVKAVLLGVDSYLVISDLLCNERTLPIAWSAVIEDSTAKQTTGFQGLKTGGFIDASLADGKVVNVVLLNTKQLGGKVKSLSGTRLVLDGQASKSRPGWFDYWDRARVVDSGGNSLGSVLTGDNVQITYLDPIPGEIDDEIPLEIVVSSRPSSKT